MALVAEAKECSLCAEMQGMFLGPVFVTFRCLEFGSSNLDGQHYVFNNVNLQIRHNVTRKRQSLFASKVCSLCQEMFLHNMLTLITLQDAITLVVIEQNNLVSLM